MYTRLWKLITKHMEENSRMAVFLTSAMLIWTIGITMAGILVCIIKHMNVICRLSDLIVPESMQDWSLGFLAADAFYGITEIIYINNKSEAYR